MKRVPLSYLLSLLLLVGGAAVAGADADADLLARIERLHEEDRHTSILALVDGELGRATDSRQRAELLWRKARAQLTLADYGVWRGELSDREGISRLEEAEASAAQAIELAPDSADPYFWKSAAMGLRGQLRGVLNSLFMASDVRDYAQQALERNPNHTEAHYLLGQLYRELPRRPLSFGNRDRAVEYGRRAVQLHEREYRDGVVGVRYAGFEDTRITVEYGRGEALGDEPLFPFTVSSAALWAERQLWRDRLSAELLVVGFADELPHSAFGRATLTYTPRDDWQISLGYALFAPKCDKPSPIAGFDRHNRLMLQLRRDSLLAP